MQILGIDHVILGCGDLTPTAAAWERLGLRLTPPMRHHDASTENRVFFVGDADTEFYVELLTVHDRALAEREGRTELLAAIGRGGLYRLMLQVESAQDARAHLEAHDVAVATRVVSRDDGSPIGTVVEPTGEVGAGCSFALIDYEAGAAPRRARHRTSGLFHHDFPLRRLDHLAVIAHDVDGPAAFWHDVLGVATTGNVVGRGMDIRQLRIGDATLELIGPHGDDSPVAQRPEGLVSVTAFEVSDLDQAIRRAQSLGFELPDAAAGVLPGSRVSTIGPDQLGGLALQLIAFD